MTTMYGIPNCDTIKKAKRFLQNKQLEFDFHDYKKQGVSADFLNNVIAEKGMAVVLNKRGTTYRKLDEQTKQALEGDKAVTILADNPSMIKRPILVHEQSIVVGFSESEYEELFSGE